MARSRKHTPISGHTTAKSEKEDKRNCNRALRRNNKQKVHTEDYEIFLEKEEVMTPWEMAKDGKAWIGDLSDKDWFPKAMRK